MEVCHHCGVPILPADLVWGSRLVCRQTMSSPEEYDEAPFYLACFVQHGEEAAARDLFWRDEAAHARHMDEGGLDVR